MGRVVARLSRRVGPATILGTVALAVAFQIATANAAISKATFCARANQLQNWIAQDFLVGIDQYQDSRALPLVKTEARYLRGLANEAPAAIKRDLSAWASFTERVAARANPTDLKKQVAAVTAAAHRVGQWLASKSGCGLAYIQPPPKPSKGTSVVVWIVIAVLALGAIGAVLSRIKPPEPGPEPPHKDPGSGHEPFKPQHPEQPAKCGYPGCTGGKIRCYLCQGNRVLQDPDTGKLEPCPGPCLRTGWIDCPRCHGAGTEPT